MVLAPAARLRALRQTLTYIPPRTVKFIDALETVRQENEALGADGEGNRAECLRGAYI